MDNEIYNKIVDIIRKEVNQPDLVLSEESGSKDVEGWNSLQHVMIISAVENEFNFKIDFMELLNIQTVGDICAEVIKNQK